MTKFFYTKRFVRFGAFNICPRLFTDDKNEKFHFHFNLQYPVCFLINVSAMSDRKLGGYEYFFCRWQQKYRRRGYISI